MCAFHISFVAMECRFVGENVNFFENVKKYETQKWKPKIRRKHKESKADAIVIFRWALKFQPKKDGFKKIQHKTTRMRMKMYFKILSHLRCYLSDARFASGISQFKIRINGYVVALI